MRRLAFAVLASLIVALSAAAPARAYFPHLHHPHFYHFHHHHRGAVPLVPLVPAAPVQPLTPGQVIGAIQLGQQAFQWFFPNGLGGNNPAPAPAPAPEPRVSPEVTKTLDDNATRLNGVVDQTNALLKLVRESDRRYTEKNLPDVPKVGGGAGGGVGGGKLDGKLPQPGPNPKKDM